MIINTLKVIFSFALTALMMCILNFLAQIGLILFDIISRWDSSALLIVTLWFVTGVFTSVFTEPVTFLLVDKKLLTSKFLHTIILVISVIALAGAGLIMFQGDFLSDPSEFTLLFSNGIIFTSYFIGTGVFSFIGRKL